MDKMTVIVTGGAQGIGAACVKAFLGAGWNVAVCDINEESGSAFVAGLGVAADRARFYRMDVTSESGVTEVVGRAAADFGSVDALVNNAGITQDGLFLRMKPEQWHRVLNVNLTGAFNCARAVVPLMVRKRFGRIINMASVVGEMGNAGQANYCASKAGLIGFTKSLAKELGSRNITVNAVAPGYVETEMTRALDEKARQEFLRIIPLQRPATPEDIAGAVLFLAGESASYITGHVLDVNGGMYM
ncbi:MAG: 3-oxoacyl-[acyl-carrier-protein] reductase [Acidobacteria bacterium]|nr:3-oxoacyl-[acyl-carrier-protein] reductase [Acidobacteriota bacterium]